MHAQDEVWNTISIKGPQLEIERLKELCSLPDAQFPSNEPIVDFSRLMPDSRCGQQYWTSNLMRHGPHESGSYRFCFDCSNNAPIEIFERLAEEFPTLIFQVDCMASADEFMAEGKYNDPPGCSIFMFSQIPDDYWGITDEDDEE